MSLDRWQLRESRTHRKHALFNGAISELRHETCEGRYSEGLSEPHLVIYRRHRFRRIVRSGLPLKNLLGEKEEEIFSRVLFSTEW